MQQDEKVDLRVQKTEQALVDAMLRLVKEKPFHEITVSDLCESARIRRATFYKHFKDKFAFLDYCIEKKQQSFETLWEGKNAGAAIEGHMPIIDGLLCYLQENRTLLSQAAKLMDTGGMAELFTQRMAQILRQKARYLEGSGKTLIAPPDVLAAFYTGALIGIARWWLEQDMEMPKEELCGHIHRLLAGGISQMTTTRKMEGDHER